MKNVVFAIFAAVIFSLFAAGVNAQMSAPYGTESSRLGMGGFSNSTADWESAVEHTAREEKEGKELWDKLQAKEVKCSDLGDEKYGALGEYFMGAMMGNSHAAMNAMMIQAHGKEGEEKIHIVMGKRLSGCDASAAFPSQTVGFMPMMQMMGGWPYGSGSGWSSPFGLNNGINSMMNYGFMPFGLFGWFFMVLVWALIIFGVFSLIRWFMNQTRGTRGGEKSPLEILKERYARGEIERKEFEEMKKDLA